MYIYRTKFKTSIALDWTRGRSGKRGKFMRRYVVVVIALIGIAAVSIAAQPLQLGIVGRFPPAVSVQLTLFQRFAVEIGLSDAIPLVVSIKTYPGELELGALTLRPLAGLGVGLAFIPGVTLQA